MPIAKRAYASVHDVFQEFAQDNGALISAAMAFFGMLSLIPLLLLAIAALGYAIGSERAFNAVLGFIRDYLPIAAEELRTNLQAVRRSSGVFGGLGLLGLFWTGSQLFVTLQLAMNIALDVEERLNFLVARLRAFAMVIVAGVLFATSTGLTWTISVVRAFDYRLFGVSASRFDTLWDLILTLVPILISMTMFFLIYKYLPTIEMGFSGPLLAGVTAGALFELAKWAFGLYVTSFGHFTAVYGSIGGVVVLMLWIYYVSLITVLGAEVASVYRKHERSAESGGEHG